MKKVKGRWIDLQIMIVILLLSSNLYGSNAPVTKIARVTNAVPGEQLTVPVNVYGFENIRGFTLAFDYEYEKLHFNSGTKNSQLNGICNIGDIDLGNGFHRLTISWYTSDSKGISLVDGSSIVDYGFTFISGSASLVWFDMGPSCVYNDTKGKSMNDVPASDFYFNGLVSEDQIPKPEISVEGPTRFMEGDQVILASSPGLSYLWSNGDTTSSIVVTASGSYSVQTTNSDGVMSDPSDPIEVSVISIGNAQLFFRLANPRIIKDNVNHYFEFEVQLKSNVDSTWFWRGQLNLDFNKQTLSSKQLNWQIIPDDLFGGVNTLGNQKYTLTKSISESMLNVEFRADSNAIDLTTSENDFVKIATDYQLIATIRGVIISKTKDADVEFNEKEMDGKYFYRIAEFPYLQSYSIINDYDLSGFLDISDLLTENQREIETKRNISCVVCDQHLIIKGNISDNTFASFYDLNGRLLWTEKLNTSYENAINISIATAGVYILAIHNYREVQSFKIPIQE